MTPRSAWPQNSCTRDTLPWKSARYDANTGSMTVSARQNRVAASGSYARCVVSSGNGIGSGTSCASGESSTSMPSLRNAPLKSDQNSATGRARSGTGSASPSAVRITTSWWRRSASTSNTPTFDGTGPVVSPRADTYSVMCAHSGSLGDSATRTLPRICRTMWSVPRVSDHSS